MESKLPFENELEKIFLGKFPAFPENVKEGLVKYGPYVMLFFTVIGLFGLLGALGIGGAAIGMAGMSYGIGYHFYVGIITGIITMLLYLMAFNPLRNRKRAGWNLLYYAMLLSLLGSLLQVNIFSFIVGGALGFWVLFQIREKYA
ncbi:hypothetical protein CLV98_10270 [Dyadobacter jejuensis]|uniref:Chromate transporter n=1 Tax=Dyadobacter jejuensis TaxID=1082580 RepID=A0A316AP33_9BACT|nr:hypothetical protein [Dyadobacter jejuensis]PWJ59238.1 hypothetical protein CLV98_10270 [Dyadobacter jejuensis]